ncbi:hypothetical protein DFH08DRAFT_124973 [Mycena albidolilacea]|uniref:Uncharacterized protein n=1 Tax=Mycena albidolilacea TaxID=1033008 RepID=A0AAD7A5E4_9AGAR|nr:hypothetical protein DFH08DRAFT_124973 [Mycena albidolilacea]
MPVTFSVADHPANPVTLQADEVNGLSPELLLARACAHQYKKAGEILRSSFDPPRAPKPTSGLNRRLSKLNQFPKSSKSAQSTPAPAPDTGPVLVPTPNGLVHTIIRAYNKHHNLVLRPDDVWLALLTQFNFFVNANAEALRASFVAHEGKKELVVQEEAPKYEMDFARLAREMADLLGTVVVDPDLRAWVLPDFSTTTDKDTTVGAIIMMSTLKAYFEYVFESIDCGIPRVTLEGTKKDWESILGRLEKLKEYGMQTTAWYHLLVPVITRFVRSFDAPESAANVEFWQQVAHFVPGGSGPSHYSGWISAFCVFDPEGKWIGLPLRENPPPSPVSPESLSAKDFWAHYGNSDHYYYTKSMLSYDDTPFHMVEADNIPSSYVEVPVKLRNEGETKTDPCTMVAGVVGTLATVGQDDGQTRDTVRPVTGWWMYLDKGAVRDY